MSHGPHPKNKTVVLLPSAFILRFCYKPLIKKLETIFNVYTVTFPATGLNFHARKAWTTEDYADWLLNDLAQKDISDALVIGHSNSGPVALLAATMDATTMDATTRDAKRITAVVLADIVGVKPIALTELFIGRLRDIWLEMRFTLRAAIPIIINLLLHPRNFFCQLRLASRESVERFLPKAFSTPVLICWGARDYTLPVERAHILSVMISSSEVSISERGAHDWLVDEEDKFVSLILNWLDRVSIR